MHDVIPQFEKASGHTVKPTFLVINAIAERVRKGDVADLVAVSPPQRGALRREGKLDPDIRIAIAKVGFGVFVKKGAGTALSDFGLWPIATVHRGAEIRSLLGA